MTTISAVNEARARGKQALAAITEAANVKRGDVAAMANSSASHAHLVSHHAFAANTEQQHGLAVSAHEAAADAWRKAGNKDMADVHESIADAHRDQMDNPPPDDDGDDDNDNSAGAAKSAT